MRSRSATGLLRWRHPSRPRCSVSAAGNPCLADRASELVPARVRLGRWMQLPRHARGANPGAQFRRCSHVPSASAPHRIRWFRCGARSDRPRRPVEDTEICARLQRRYLDGVYLYEPKALVRRHVPRSRTTWSYYRSRCYAEGVSKAVVRGLAGPEWTMSSEKSYLRSIIPRAIGRNLVKALRGQPERHRQRGGPYRRSAHQRHRLFGWPNSVAGQHQSTQVRWPTMTELGAIGR